MHLQHVVVGADHSDEGKAAILAAARLARQAGARVTVLTVTSAPEANGARHHTLESLRQLAQSALRPLADPPEVRFEVTAGLAGVELVRFAESLQADLIVIGRKRRSGYQRLLVGDTADSVARRSRVPCLFVIAGAPAFDHVLVALDGSERGMAVLVAAMDFTRDTATRLHAVSVEPAYENELGVAPLLTGRSARLQEAFESIRSHANLGPGQWETPSPQPSPMVIHRGRVVEEIVREVVSSGTDVLVVGYHRGGPAGIIEAGSVARRLAHESPCSVLTIPL